MIIRNLSTRDIVFVDGSNTSYTAVALGDLTLSDAIWSDATFRRSVHSRIRDLVVIATTAAIASHATTHNPGGADALSWTTVASTILLRSTSGSRPAAASGNQGFHHYAYDTGVLTRSRTDSLAWEQIAAGVFHQQNHQTGGSDALLGTVDAIAKSSVSKNTGAVVGSRRLFNFIEGSNITLTVTDVPGSERVDVTIAGPIQSGAPSAATYVTTAAEAGLSAETVLSTVIGKGTLASRTTASIAGRLYYVTDSGSARMTRDTGAAWEDLLPDWTQILNKPSTFTPSAHATAHQTGGADALTGNLDANARVNVRVGGSSIATRRGVNFIEGAGITLGAADNAGSERVDVTITGTAISTGTSLPGSPTDGTEYIYVADAANGVYWRFKYRTALTKWIFLGGAALFAEVSGGNTTASSSYVDLASAGPTVTLPLAGTYDVSIGATTFNTDSGSQDLMSYAVGGSGASDSDAVRGFGQSNFPISIARTRRKSVGAVALTSKYRTTFGTATFQDRWMQVIPVTLP